MDIVDKKTQYIPFVIFIAEQMIKMTSQVAAMIIRYHFLSIKIRKYQYQALSHSILRYNAIDAPSHKLTSFHDILSPPFPQAQLGVAFRA